MRPPFDPLIHSAPPRIRTVRITPSETVEMPGHSYWWFLYRRGFPGLFGPHLAAVEWCHRWERDGEVWFQWVPTARYLDVGLA